MLLCASSIWTKTLGYSRHIRLDTKTPRVSFSLQATMNDATASPLRILALHGSEGTAASLQKLLENYLRDVNCEITTIQAPFQKGSGYAWWQLRPGERSFTAQTYPGYSESAALVTQAFQETDFDVVLGHSQGVILLVAMLADGQLGLPTRRILLNGVAWPNPFSERLSSSVDKDWNHLEALQIIGVQDRINPPEQALRVGVALRNRGCKTTQLHHPGGHSIPSDERVWTIIVDWLARRSLNAIHFVEPESLL